MSKNWPTILISPRPVQQNYQFKITCQLQKQRPIVMASAPVSGMIKVGTPNFYEKEANK
jgi:hypothetical protein